MEFRNQLVDFLKQGLMGPNPIPGKVQENGEEIIFGNNPCDRYSLGILFPQKSENQKVRDEEESDESPDNIGGNSENIEDVGSEEATEEVVNLANSMSPSAMGFSCGLKIPFSGLEINIKAGIYTKAENYEENGKKINAYFRRQLIYKLNISGKEIEECGGKLVYPLGENAKGDGLAFVVLRRNSNTGVYGGELFTFSLINQNVNGWFDKCFFQCEFEVRSSDGNPCFAPYSDISEKQSVDHDRLLNSYLYLSKKTFAIGHGCSPLWDDTAVEIDKITASVFPYYEIKPVIPHKIANCTLGMREMSDLGNTAELFLKIETLCSEYEKWINSQNEIVTAEANPQFNLIGKENINNCFSCLARMRSGLDLLRNNGEVLESFRLMNRAMLLQQLRYRMKLREWGNNDSIDILSEPDLTNELTWPSGVGNWYPFQLAFILMNLNSISNPHALERELVDLIWFPTGGGKTEAYLGLTAFTIFLKRLRDKNDDGTTVLMRYTLRLLTNQQFQRAASLICACEFIRNEIPDKLGNSRITIGLWAGQGLTPNSCAEAVTELRNLQKGQGDANKFLIEKCPWCGAQMGFIKQGSIIKVKGYRQTFKPSTVVFRCSDQNCFFSGEKNTLPLSVIDEDIYEKPPSLIVGTIDKFAMITWKPDKIRSIFGFRQGRRISPPSLIIQDELHLISGPLGSVAGMYEAMVEKLCTSEDGIRPKIVASTATVSRAKEQVNSLYNREVFIFPSPAIKANDSFFAKEDMGLKGRMYVGIYAPALSHATTHVRTVSFLLQGVKSINAPPEVKNYYWTLLDYFNSLRELGHAATRISADIPEYLNIVYGYLGLIRGTDQEKALRRFIDQGKCRELTSREDRLSKALNDLKEPYTEVKYPNALDICLCTNMVSVGIDIDRLGLMTVAGQPKTTAEYIQATSRVGRDKNGPGLVVVIFNTPKPRDRSHYENFISYHSKIYSHVEPTSITPFSKPARERALHALLISYIRYFGSDSERTSPRDIKNTNLFEEFKEMIRKRVENIDPAECEGCLSEIEKLRRHWQRLKPPKYSDNQDRWTDCLIYPYGLTPPQQDIKMRMWPTLQSMRNVDLTCQIEPDAFYSYNSENEL